MEGFDVAVVGGGITGAGVLRDCALRGLSAVLLEKGRPGGGTTGASTHLIHGGLRYLLYDRLTTHTTSWDSGNIVRIAGPLLTRLPLLWPLYKGQRHGPATVESLLEAYDGFQRMKAGRPHLRLGAQETLRLAPMLKPEGLLGSLSFDEWWLDAAAFVERNLDSARGLGAKVMTGVEVTGVLRDGTGSVCGLRARGQGGVETEVRARVVVNAGGPWADKVARLAGCRVPLRLRKGTHLVYRRPIAPVGLLLEAEDRERFIFAIPHRGGTLVGPTDVPAGDDPDALSSDDDEVRYLLGSLKRWLPAASEAFAGLTVGARPILGQAGSEKLLSREYEIIDHAKESSPGFVSAAGGKLSDYRLMARDAVDLACRKLGKDFPCRTDRVALDGTELPEAEKFPLPPRWLKTFLRSHPRLRELHALAHLGAGLTPILLVARDAQFGPLPVAF